MSRLRSWHQPRRDGYAAICEHCDHVHLGAPGEACHNSENREHLCGCTGTPDSVINLCERSDSMAKKSNGKHEDNGKVQGEDAKAGPLSLRVVSAALTEAKEGGQKATIKIAGVAKGLSNLVGEAVRIETLAAETQMLGRCTEVTIRQGKDGKPRTVSAKITGAPNLHQLVGRPVRLEKTQRELFRSSEEGAGAEA